MDMLMLLHNMTLIKETKNRDTCLSLSLSRLYHIIQAYQRDEESQWSPHKKKQIEPFPLPSNAQTPNATW